MVLIIRVTSKLGYYECPGHSSILEFSTQGAVWAVTDGLILIAKYTASKHYIHCLWLTLYFELFKNLGIKDRQLTSVEIKLDLLLSYLALKKC